MPQGDGGLLCARGFNPIDVLVEDALEVGGPPDTGDTVEAFTNFIDRLLTQVDCSPSGAPSRPHTREARALWALARAPGLTRACLTTRLLPLARLAQSAGTGGGSMLTH